MSTLSDGQPDALFREEQRFRQPLIGILVLGIALMAWYAFVFQIVVGQPFGTRPMPNELLVIFWLLFGFGLPIFMFSVRLVTEVRIDGIYFRYSPLQRTFRRVGFEELERMEPVTYRPLLDYGGWGIRYGRGRRWAYTIGGNQGIELDVTDGRRLLIGSQDAERLAEIIQELLQSE